MSNSSKAAYVFSGEVIGIARGSYDSKFERRLIISKG